MSKYYKTMLMIVSADIIVVAIMFLLSLTGTVKYDKLESTTALSQQITTITNETISSDNPETTVDVDIENTVPADTTLETINNNKETISSTEQFIVLSTTSKVYLRKMPSTNSEIIKELSPDSYGNVISKDGKWTKVEYEGTTGYVYSEYLATGTTASDLINQLSVSKVVINKSCNMRHSPDTNDTVFGNAPAGQTYKYNKSESDENWYAIYLEDGSMAYISTSYASITN